MNWYRKAQEDDDPGILDEIIEETLYENVLPVSVDDRKRDNKSLVLHRKAMDALFESYGLPMMSMTLSSSREAVVHFHDNLAPVDSKRYFPIIKALQKIRGVYGVMVHNRKSPYVVLTFKWPVRLVI